MKIKEGGVMDIQKNRKEHVLKTDPAVFQDVLDGKKTFEIRFNDRGYQVGDLIVLKETKFTGQQMREGSPLIYTGREMQKQISYILSGYGLQDGWVILGIQDIKATKAQAVPEGFVLVPKEPTDKTIAHMINTPIEVNLLCDHADVFLSEGEAYIAYQAMIEAQEPAND